MSTRNKVMVSKDGTLKKIADLADNDDDDPDEDLENMLSYKRTDEDQGIRMETRVSENESTKKA